MGAFSASATNGFIGNLGHFGLMHTLGTPSPGSPLIPELLYSFYQLQFCVLQQQLLWVPLLSAVASFLLWSSSSHGPRSYTAQSHAGSGMSTDGPSTMVFWIMLEADLSKLFPVCLLWHILWFSADVKRR